VICAFTCQGLQGLLWPQRQVRPGATRESCCPPIASVLMEISSAHNSSASAAAASSPHSAASLLAATSLPRHETWHQLHWAGIPAQSYRKPTAAWRLNPPLAFLQNSKFRQNSKLRQSPSGANLTPAHTRNVLTRFLCPLRSC